jgi:hypothetical protein
MTREELELMWELRRVCEQVPDFVLEFTDGAMSVTAEEAYGLQLIDLGERLLAHAKARKGLALDGEPTPLVIEAGYAHLQNGESSELPPGNEPDGGETMEPPPPHQELE